MPIFTEGVDAHLISGTDFSGPLKMSPTVSNDSLDKAFLRVEEGLGLVARWGKVIVVDVLLREEGPSWRASLCLSLGKGRMFSGVDFD